MMPKNSETDRPENVAGRPHSRQDIHARLRHAIVDQGFDIVVERDLDQEEDDPANDASDPRGE